MHAAKPDVAEDSINERLVQLLNLLQELGALCRPHGNQHAGQGVITDHGIYLPPLLEVQTRQQASLSLRSSSDVVALHSDVHCATVLLSNQCSSLLLNLTQPAGRHASHCMKAWVA